MEIQITCKGCAVSDDIRQYIDSRLAKLLTYDKSISGVSILLKKERRARKIQLKVASGSSQYIANTYSSEFIKSIKIAIDRIATQVKKRAEKDKRPS